MAALYNGAMDRFLELLRVEAERTSPTMVAARIGCSEQSVKGYLAGKNVPGGDIVIRALQEYPSLRACLSDKDSRPSERAQKPRAAASA